MVFLLYGLQIMNKSDIILKLAEKFSHLPPTEVEKMLEKIILTFSESMISGERIEIRGFGTFSIKHRDERKARNPKTGEEIFVKAKKSIHFKSSKEIRNLINKNKT